MRTCGGMLGYDVGHVWVRDTGNDLGLYRSLVDVTPALHVSGSQLSDPVTSEVN